MSRLLDRNRQIPGGYVFYEPSTKWKPPAWCSFDRLVNLVISHRKGNPSLIEKNKWATDYETVAIEVDEFNARVCVQMGWTDYIAQSAGASPPPKPLSPQQRNELGAAAGRVKKIWAGVKTLNDWIDSGDPPVPYDHAIKRAAICSECPQNGQGDWSTWFTTPASEAIRKQIERLQERKLSTPYDDKLNVCLICMCPLRLKSHTPLEYIKDHMSDSVLDELSRVPNCWIVSEIRGLQT